MLHVASAPLHLTGGHDWQTLPHGTDTGLGGPNQLYDNVDVEYNSEGTSPNGSLRALFALIP